MARQSSKDQIAAHLAARLRDAARVDAASRQLTERERDVLASLTDEWVRPMDIGGRDSSYHSRVLASLFRKGLVERKGISSYRYRNPNYVKPKPVMTRFDKAMRFTRILAGYECAGISQEGDDPKTCGKCGPCEANQFVKSLPVGFWMSIVGGE